MKQLLSLVLGVAALTAVAQPKKAPKMAPMTAEGYYVGGKKDTVRGEIQTNPDDLMELYKSFNFKPAKGGKLMPVSPKKAKAYGYDNKHFIQIPYEDGDIYVEVLARGRLCLYEYRFNGKVDGLPGIEYAYFVQDNQAEGEDADLKEIKKINNKFYKKDLEKYMKDQKMIWQDLDKFKFDRQKVINAFNDFNKYYVVKTAEE